MPRLIKGAAGDMIQGKVGSFQYSAIRPGKLSSTEYTLVTVMRDISSSISGFEAEINDCLKTSLRACKLSPRAGNLLIRYVTFGSQVREEHGFTPLDQINPDDYQPVPAGGSTHLRDALYSGLGAAHAYGKTLTENNYNVNAITFAITDGQDVGSTMGVDDIKREIDRAKSSEDVESHVSVLIAINAAHCLAELQALQKAAGLTSFIDAGNVDEKTLAKLANFISRSISSQSSSLGSGGPSQPLTI